MSVSVIKPIEVTEAVYSASGIAEPDISRGEVEWENYESKRVIIEPIPQPSSDRSFFGVYYNESVHDTARYFFYKVEGSTDYFVGLDLSLSEVFKVELTPDPSLTGTQSITGIHVNIDGLVTVFWRTLDVEYTYTYNTFTIPPNGTPIYYNSGVELVDIDPDLKANGTLTSFTSSSFGYVVWSSFQNPSNSWVSTLKLITNTGATLNSIASSAFITGVYGDESSLYTIDSTIENKIKLSRYNKDLKLGAENEIDQYNGGGVGFLGGGGNSLNVGVFAGTFFDNDPVFEVISKSTLDGINLYQKGDEVITTSNHRKYKSLINSNKSDPRETATGDATAEWIDIGPTNKWAMFDDSISTKSVVSSQFSFDLSAGTKFDAIAFFGCEGIQYISVTIKNIGGTFVESRSVDMIDSDAALEWGLDDNSPAFISDAMINDLTYGDGYYATVTITPYAGFDAKVQLVSFGLERFLGKVISESTRQNYQDLSDYKFDEFGESVIVKRPVIKMDTYSILTDGARVGVVDRFIKSMAGQFNVWYANIGNGQYMLTYGSYERSPTNVMANNHRNYVVTVRSAV